MAFGGEAEAVFGVGEFPEGDAAVGEGLGAASESI